MQISVSENSHWLITSLEIMSALFIFIIGMIALWIVITFIADITQSRQAIRRNYPVIGRFRYLLEKLGTFFRQYFFPWTGKNGLSTTPRELNRHHARVVLANGLSIPMHKLYAPRQQRNHQ